MIERAVVITTVHILQEHLGLVRRATLALALAAGGHPSVSAVIGDLIEANRAKLEKMAK